MKRLWDFYCEECDLQTERFIEVADKDFQFCFTCGAPVVVAPAVLASWSPSKERTTAQLKSRSRQHMADCAKKGQHPDDSRPGKGDARWRNAQRAKNTSRSTMDQWANVHKTYQPGRVYSATGEDITGPSK